MGLPRISLILSGLVFLVKALSQTVLISPEINIKNDFSYYILTHPNGTASLLRDRSFKLIYQTLYPDYEWSVEKSIEIPGKKWRIIEAYERGNDLSLFYISKQESDYSINYAVYNLQAELLSNRILHSGLALSNNEGLKIQSSEDKNWMAIGYFDAESERQLLLYNRKEDSVYFNINLERLLKDDNTTIREIEIGNAGQVFVFGRTKEESTGKRKYQTTISHIGLTGEKVKSLILVYETVIFTNGFAKFDNKNRLLIVGGLYSDKVHQQPKGYVFNCLTEDLDIVSSVNTPYTQELLDEWNGKSNKSVLASSELNTRNVILRNDGGCLIFYENTKELSRRPYFSSSDPTGAFPSRWFDYYFDDIIIASFNKEGRLEWDRVLHKRQYSQDDEGLFSSFFVFRTGALLGIIFNDAISSEGTVSEYLLKPNGDHIRKSILNTSYKNLNLRFQDAIELDARSLLVPSENNGRLNLVKIIFD